MWKKFRYLDRNQIFLVLFLAGIVVGTVAGNRVPAGALSLFSGSMSGSTPWRKQSGSLEKLGYLIWQRLEEGAIGWLFGMTACSVPLFFLLAVYLGFALGWVISSFTVRMGALGLWGFLLSVFPQGFCYLPAWYLIIWKGLNRPGKLKLLAGAAAAALLLAGAAAECFLNPKF